jgi:hypothetical protein
MTSPFHHSPRFPVIVWILLSLLTVHNIVLTCELSEILPHIRVWDFTVILRVLKIFYNMINNLNTGSIG